MDEEKISVIIPVYKVEAYLRACVDSVRAQTYRDLEIILVDDGSPDGCGALCDALAAEDGRIRVIHKANGGLSSARNAGIDAAVGRCLCFVDSDDTVAPDMVEKLYAALTAAGADMSLCDVVRVDETGRPLPALPPLREEVLDGDQLCRRAELEPAGWRYVTAWNRLYRRALFDGLRFREGKVHEDEFLLLPLAARCRRTAVISPGLYRYLQRGGSIMSAMTVRRGLDNVQFRLERCELYREKGWRDLFRVEADRAYVSMWQVLRAPDRREDETPLRPWVGKVMRAELACGRPRAFWLGLNHLLRGCR